MFEQTLSALLQPLVATVPVYWDTTPDGFVAGDAVLMDEKIVAASSGDEQRGGGGGFRFVDVVLDEIEKLPGFVTDAF